MLLIKMISFRFIVLLLFHLVSITISQNYEDSMSDMLTQCLQYQEKIFDDTRPIHECEKENFRENSSYIIQPMTSRYSKQKFHCFHFLKESSVQVKFKIWFSHKNLKIDGYGIRNYKNVADKYESKVIFDKNFFIVTGISGFPFPDIFGFELNGVDKCPLCGKKPETLIQRIGNDDDFPEVIDWPWHVAIYRKMSGSLSYRCSGALISHTAVVTSGMLQVFHMPQ